MKKLKSLRKMIAALLIVVMSISLLPLNVAASYASLSTLMQHYPQGYTDYSTRFGYYVNNERMAGECNGFAFNAARLLYGFDLYNADQYWTWSPKNLNDVKAGDIIRYRSNSGYHTIMVTAVSGDTLSIAEANYSIKMGLN